MQSLSELLAHLEITKAYLSHIHRNSIVFYKNNSIFQKESLREKVAGLCLPASFLSGPCACPTGVSWLPLVGPLLEGGSALVASVDPWMYHQLWESPTPDALFPLEKR